MAEAFFDFEKLRVYQKALDLTSKVYKITGFFPFEERFCLIDQFRRAVVSIALNIAEGSSGTKPEFRHFLKIAGRSIRECVAIIEISFQQNYLTPETRQELRSDCADLSKMITGLQKTLTTNAEK
jgi:four helix bundle protein